MNYNITALFVCLDEFCKSFEEWEKHRLIVTGRKRHQSCAMCLCEMLTIMVLFHLSPCKNLKYFCLLHFSYFHKRDFPNLLSYSRFFQLMPRLFVPFCVLLQSLFGDETGIYIADATSGRATGRATLGQTSTLVHSSGILPSIALTTFRVSFFSN